MYINYPITAAARLNKTFSALNKVNKPSCSEGCFWRSIFYIPEKHTSDKQCHWCLQSMCKEQVLLKLFKEMKDDVGISWELYCIGIHRRSGPFSINLATKSVVILKYAVSVVRQELSVMALVSLSVISLCQKTLYQPSEGENHVVIFIEVHTLWQMTTASEMKAE